VDVTSTFLKVLHRPQRPLIDGKKIRLDKLPGFQIIPVGDQLGDFSAVHQLETIPDLVGQAAVGFKGAL
jgi:hypothetical protein